MLTGSGSMRSTRLMSVRKVSRSSPRWARRLPMTTEMLPFLLRFGEVIPPQDRAPIVYDPSRQMSRALVDGQWIDVADCAGELLGGVTKKTGVGQETTDDD